MDFTHKKMENQPIDFSDLREAQPQETRKCKYPNCNNDVMSDSSFVYCETCRTLASRNAVALILDPTAPKALEREAEVTQAMLSNLTQMECTALREKMGRLFLSSAKAKPLTSMSGDEIIAFQRSIENIYLETCKIIKLHGIKGGEKRVAKPLMEAVEEARALENAPKARAAAKKKGESRMDKLRKAMPGLSDSELKDLMGDNEFDLD